MIAARAIAWEQNPAYRSARNLFGGELRVESGERRGESGAGRGRFFLNFFRKGLSAAATSLLAMAAREAHGLDDSPQIDWQEAVGRHRRWLATVVLARVGEADAVDDVMQEVSLAVAAARSLPEKEEKVAPWLYQVAVRQSLLWRRKQGRRRKLMSHYAEKFQPQDAAPYTDPLQWLLRDERRQLVRAALTHLGGRDAEILLLKYSEDWSYQQLADYLGATRSAVEARLHRARKRLRAELAKLNVVEVSR